jgi:threonine dehydratase
MTTQPVTMRDVLAARQRITPWVRRTPLVQSEWLSRVCGTPVALKLESMQPTHSYKVRGAFNAALSLRAVEGGSGVRLVTASTGNHGRALSYATQALGLGCVVFAPATTPAVKLDGIRRAGATLMADAPNYDEAEADAMRYAAEQAETHGGDAMRVRFLSGYNDPLLIAATGTIAVEIYEDDPLVDVIVVPVGGGGLISGIALAAKAINPRVRVIGVEAANNPAMSTARARGFVANIDILPTLADAVGGNNDPQTITFEYMQRFVDDIVQVSEAEIAAAVRDLAGYDHIVAEGGGAVTSAALAAKRIDISGGQRVAAIVSGSNIDRERFASIVSAQS